MEIFRNGIVQKHCFRDAANALLIRANTNASFSVAFLADLLQFFSKIPVDTFRYKNFVIRIVIKCAQKIFSCVRNVAVFEKADGCMECDLSVDTFPVLFQQTFDPEPVPGERINRRKYISVSISVMMCESDDVFVLLFCRFELSTVQKRPCICSFQSYVRASWR